MAIQKSGAKPDLLAVETSARRQIVDTTSRLLETQGYHGTGLNQIIRESGAPRGSLYYYFPQGKEELAAEAIAQKAKGMAAYSAALLDQAEDPIAAIDSLLAALVEYTQSSHYCGGAPLAAVALEMAAVSDRLRHACEQAYAALRQPYVDKLVSGGYAPERAASLATLILAAIEGAVILSRTQQSPAPLVAVRNEVRLLLECARAQLA